MKAPVAVTYTLSFAVGSVLVASTRNRDRDRLYSARGMVMVSAALTVRESLFVNPPLTPEISTDVVVFTRLVVTVKVALVLPLATITLAGTAAINPLLLLSVTLAPPLGATRLRITVPTEVFPPVTLDGFSVSDESDGPTGVGAGIGVGVGAGVGVGVETGVGSGVGAGIGVVAGPPFPSFTTKASS